MQGFKLRKLKELGMIKMEEFLDSLKTDSPLDYPSYLLEDSAFSDAVSSIKVSQRDFKNKFDAAKYLFDTFEKASLINVIENKGLWSWLSLFYFNQLCPKGRGSKFNPGARARWIPETTNFQRYYRHLLAGPYRIYHFHRDNPKRVMALLCGELSKQGDLHEQIASRQELITNKSLIEATSLLYYDSQTGKNKRGAGGKDAGSPRRLADVIDQFNLTWDFYSMSADEILKLLPSEFDRFRPDEAA